MSYCWYCHWGWSQAVAAIYDQFAPVAGESAMHYGPAHIVWADENFDRESVQWCLDNFEEFRGDHSPEQLVAVRASLEKLLELPDEQLNPKPAAFEEAGDQANPADFPPSVPMREVRIS